MPNALHPSSLACLDGLRNHRTSRRNLFRRSLTRYTTVCKFSRGATHRSHRRFPGIGWARSCPAFLFAGLIVVRVNGGRMGEEHVSVD